MWDSLRIRSHQHQKKYGTFMIWAILRVEVLEASIVFSGHMESHSRKSFCKIHQKKVKIKQKILQLKRRIFAIHYSTRSSTWFHDAGIERSNDNTFQWPNSPQSDFTNSRCMVVFSTHGLSTRRSSPRIVHYNACATSIACINHSYVASPGQTVCPP